MISDPCEHQLLVHDPHGDYSFPLSLSAQHQQITSCPCAWMGCFLSMPGSHGSLTLIPVRQAHPCGQLFSCRLSVTRGQHTLDKKKHSFCLCNNCLLSFPHPLSKRPPKACLINNQALPVHSHYTL